MVDSSLESNRTVARASVVTQENTVQEERLLLKLCAMSGPT
jgi:hypothetical protein